MIKHVFRLKHIPVHFRHLSKSKCGQRRAWLPDGVPERRAMCCPAPALAGGCGLALPLSSCYRAISPQSKNLGWGVTAGGTFMFPRQWSGGPSLAVP